jgi:hypothetical protein
MDDPPPNRLPSLDDLAAEIVALRQRLNDLEHQMGLLRGRTAVVLPGQPPAVAAGPRAAARPPAGTTPFAQVLTADEDTAKRHLDQLRAAIVRLREERAQAAAQFRSLTRPPEQDSSATAPPEAEGADTGVRATVESAGPPFEASAADAAPPTVTTSGPVAGEGDALGKLLSEGVPAAGRRTEAASHVRTTIDDVPDLREPVEVGDEAWREVRQVVLQSEAWREPQTPPGRWRPAAAVIGIAAVALAAYGLWHARSARTGAGRASAALSAPSAPAKPAPAGPAAPTPAAANVPPPSQAAPIGTSGMTAPATSAADVAPPSASPPATLAAPAAAPARIEIQTTREVWMRTTIDDDPPVERLVPGGRTLRFDPARVLLLRAGDAGGVRIIVDGEDRGILGADGRVVTRRYEVPQRRPQS